jgi:hypothetical protein
VNETILNYVKENDEFMLPMWKGGMDGVPFTHEEYVEFSNELAHSLEDDAIDVSNDRWFKCYLMPFSWNETKFVLRLMIGQGSCLDLLTEEYYRKHWDDLPHE